jgi:hypothetical protein
VWGGRSTGIIGPCPSAMAPHAQVLPGRVVLRSAEWSQQATAVEDGQQPSAGDAWATVRARGLTLTCLGASSIWSEAAAAGPGLSLAPAAGPPQPPSWAGGAAGASQGPPWVQPPGVRMPCAVASVSTGAELLAAVEGLQADAEEVSRGAVRRRPGAVN